LASVHLPTVQQNILTVEAARMVRMGNSIGSFKYFCNTYLKNHFYLLPFSDLQNILFDLLGSQDNNRRLVIKAPRGSGKTTVVCLGYALWALSILRKRFILYIKENDDKAKSDIKKIRAELESNGLLTSDFKNMRPKRGKIIKRFLGYSDHMVILEDKRIVMAVGKGAAMRGINELGFRPDMVIYDDPQGKKEKESPSLRKKDAENLDTEIRYLAGPGESLDIILVGTMIAYDCLIDHASRKPGWDMVEVDGVKSEEEKQTYWDAVYCYSIDQLEPWELKNWELRGVDKVIIDDGKQYNTKYIRTPFYGTIYKEGEPHIVGMYDESPSAFNQEIRHMPIQLGQMPLRKELWQYYDYHNDLIPKMDIRVGALDLAMGSVRGDYQGIAILGAKKQDIFLMDASLTKFDMTASTENEVSLCRLCTLFIQMYDLNVFIIETNGTQGLFLNSLKAYMKNAGIRCKLVGRPSKGNKIERITGTLGMLIQDGRFLIRRDWQKQYPEFMRQFEFFPKLDHDDAPDVTNMGCMAIVTRRSKSG